MVCIQDNTRWDPYFLPFHTPNYAQRQGNPESSETVNIWFCLVVEALNKEIIINNRLIYIIDIIENK